MKKRKLGLYCLSALAVFGTVCGLTSCGEEQKKEDAGEVTIDVGRPSKMVELGDGYKQEAASSKYFAGYLADDDGSIVSIKSASVVEGGSSKHLSVYGLPEGWLTGVTVLRDGADASSEVKVSDDGVLEFPKVSKATSYTVQLFGVESSDEKSKAIRKSLDVTVVPEGSIAKGDYFDYSSVDGEARTAITGVGETFLYSNGVAPVVTTKQGGYQLYSSRLHSPLLDTENYVPGYGYGVLTYGTIDAPMAEEKTEAYKMFYHDQFDATGDQGSFNYLNSSEATVSDLYSYISASYFASNLNEEMTSSEYQANLSRFDAPEAVDPDANGASDTWKIYVRVGGAEDDDNGVTKGLSYRTGSSKAEIAAFDKTDITLEDYLTPFKLLATQSVGWYRGREQAGESTANRQIKGFAEFYNNSASLTELPSDEEFMRQVGVKIDHSDNSVTIKFNGKITPDYAEYQIDGLWSNPVSEDFLKVLGDGNALEGSKIYGISSSAKGYTPLDSILSVGPYYTCAYESKKTIAFAKNEEWPLCKDKYGRDMYQIAGVHLNINSALSTNANEYIEKFEAGLTDVSNIPTDYWDKYVSSPLRKPYVGSSNNGNVYLNTYDKKFWDETFSSEASSLNPSYEVKPVLSNNDFYKGLFVGIDRAALAEYSHGYTSYDLQQPVAKASPKAELYNSTSAHSKALKSAFNGAIDDATAWKAEAAEYFEKAIEEELAAGHYKLGTEASPTEFSFSITSIDSAARNFYFTNFTENWKDAFELAVQTHSENGKNPWVGANGKSLITLNVIKNDVPQTSTMVNDIIYNGVQAGTTDGQNVYSITGNAYDTANNIDIYKSDNSSGFCLSFGGDTANISSDMLYNGKYWSFDSLWAAANGGVLLDENGKATDPVSLDKANAKITPDVANQSYTVEMPISIMEKFASNFSVQTEDYDGGDYDAMVDCDWEIKDGMIKVTFDGYSCIDGDPLGYSGQHVLYAEVSYDFTYGGETTTKTVSFQLSTTKAF